MTTKKKNIRVTLVRSPIGHKPKQRATLKALGLGRINSVVEKVGNPAILGMIARVSHLVAIKEL